ncbi:hypothetical protein ACTMTF_12660 [Nonomuraea sp. ZG12]|uniref:hypothetical protein n=1 Tax=Nonomuraea sp. ZG12 TaxID=3452207 RepID=UPI003F88EFC3
MTGALMARWSSVCPAQRVTGYEPLSGFAVDTVAAVTLESGARAVFKAAAACEVEVELWALWSMAERGASSTGDLP